MKLDRSLVKGSFILLIAFGLFNLFHFLFQFFMVRMLSISEYGILASLFAIIYILMVLSESIQTVIVKYSTKEESKGALKSLLKKSLRKTSSLSIFILILYLILSIPLSFLLNINYLLLSLNGVVIFMALFLPITRGIMQGKKKFKSLGANMILESVSKLVLGILFVYLGWKVYGAIIGVIAGGFIALLFSVVSLRDIVESKEENAKLERIYDYARPTFLITLMIIMFYSIDVVIAKILFNPDIAGVYAIASILGKIILWGTLPISKAMFPISAGDNTEKKADNIFGNSLIILLACISFLLVIFYLFSDKIVIIFSGKNVPEAASILFFMGIAFSFISLANLVLLYKLSIGKYKGYPYLFIFVAVEIFLLIYFSNNLFQFSIAFITASAMLLWGSIFILDD